MTDKLPPNLLALFAPRPQLRYIPPSDHAPEDRRTAHITPISAFLPALRAKAEKAKGVEAGEPISADDPEPENPPTLSKLEERNNRIAEKQAHQKWLVEEGWKTMYEPKEDSNIRGSEYKTMFLARLPYDVDTKDIENKFGRYGPIERVKIVLDHGKTKPHKKPKPRGYAFVVFEHEADFVSTSIPLQHPCAVC